MITMRRIGVALLLISLWLPIDWSGSGHGYQNLMFVALGLMYFLVVPPLGVGALASILANAVVFFHPPLTTFRVLYIVAAWWPLALYLLGTKIQVPNMVNNPAFYVWVAGITMCALQPDDHDAQQAVPADGPASRARG